MLWASSRGKTASSGGAGAVASDDDGNLLLRQAAFAGFAAPLSRRSGKVFGLALERFQDECLVSRDDAGQRARLVEVESGKKAMTAAKRGGGIDPTTLGRLRNGLAADQGSRLCLGVQNFARRDTA